MRQPWRRARPPPRQKPCSAKRWEKTKTSERSEPKKVVLSTTPLCSCPKRMPDSCCASKKALYNSLRIRFEKTLTGIPALPRWTFSKNLPLIYPRKKFFPVWRKCLAGTSIRTSARSRPPSATYSFILQSIWIETMPLCLPSGSTWGNSRIHSFGVPASRCSEETRGADDKAPFDVEMAPRDSRWKEFRGKHNLLN